MTSMELIEILNSIRDNYILEANEFGQKKERKKPGSSVSHPAGEPLSFPSRKEPHHYQAVEIGKRKKKNWKKYFILSAAAGLLLAALAGRGVFTQWSDYFAAFLVKTEEQYQYTQPVDETNPFQPETEPTQPETVDASEETEGNSIYDAYFNAWMPGSVGSDAYSPYYEQKFLDLNGDGLDEMVIWESTTGIVYEVVTMEEGQTLTLYTGSIFKLDEHEEEMYLCQDNTLEKFYPNPLQGQRKQEYYRMEDQDLVMVECIMQGMDNKWYWSESGGASSLAWTEISESEVKTVQENHVRVEVKQLLPVSQETTAIIKAEAEERLQSALENQFPLCSLSVGEEILLKDYCSMESDRMQVPVEVTRYAWIDLDEDGILEGVVDFRFGENEQVMCLVLKYENGTIYATEFYYRQMYQLKSDGTFAYSGEGSNNGWARLRWENMSWVTEPVSDEENCESKPDAPWQTYESPEISE